jgi:hypothetical protein
MHSLPPHREEELVREGVVKVVKVKMVIFVFGFGHLLTIYKYKYLLYSGGF